MKKSSLRVQPRTYVDVRSVSQKGLTDELEQANNRLEKARDEHAESLAVLAGTQNAKDGTHRAGDPLTARGAQRRTLLLLLAFAGIAVALPLILPMGIESKVISTNVRDYMRLPDGDLWAPWFIAVSAILALTVAPFLIGKRVNKAIHGKPFTLWERVVYAVGAFFWLGTAVLMAFIRVGVDQAARVAQVEAQRIEAAEATGEVVEPVIADQVFNPVIPTIWWILVLAGMGATLLLIETFDNPSKRVELKRRLAVLEFEAQVDALAEDLAQVEGQIALAEEHLAASLAMWDEELLSIKSRAERDKQVYRAELCVVSGDPAMANAIQTRDRRTVEEQIAKAWAADTLAEPDHAR